MKLRLPFSIAIWLSLILVIPSKHVRHNEALEMQRTEEKMAEEKMLHEVTSQQRTTQERMTSEKEGRNASNVEERALVSSEKATKYAKDKAGEFGALITSSVDAGIKLYKIDYSQPAGDIAWQVADAVVPMIAAALAFIPGFGPIISGVFSGVWSVVSAIWGPKEENPMEKMIKDMADTLRKEMDEKLSNIIKLGIYGEISRNTYICNKYDRVSQLFADKFNKSEPLERHDAINLRMYLNDCDNFLKDTAEAFVYDNYADVLWVPSAITTTARLGFLAEITKNGHLMGLTAEAVAIYVLELKTDTKRQFNFYVKGQRNQNSGILKNPKIASTRTGGQKDNYLKDVTAVEKAACAMQNQLFYFDAELYPYGMPTILNNTDMFPDINMTNYYKPNEKGVSVSVKHVQIFFNVTNGKFPGVLPERAEPYAAMEFMNCFLGPMYLKSPDTFWFNFYPMLAKQKYSYEFRVILIQTLNNTDYVPILTPFMKKNRNYDKKHKKYTEVLKAFRNLRDPNTHGKTFLNIEFVNKHHERFNQSQKLIEISAMIPWKKCPYPVSSARRVTCELYDNGLPGTFQIFSAGTFNHNKENLVDLMGIDELPNNGGFLVGLEIILRPFIK